MLHLGVTTVGEVLGVTRLAPGLSINSSEPLEEFDTGHPLNWSSLPSEVHVLASIIQKEFQSFESSAVLNFPSSPLKLYSVCQFFV